MKKEFKDIYETIVKEYGEKYKPKPRKITSKTVIYILFAWLILGFIKAFIGRFVTSESLVYLIFQLIYGVFAIVLIILVFRLMNSNMNYWKKAFNFKNEVGNAFWKNFDENINYITDRANIDKAEVKTYLDNMYKNSEIVDVEDMLDYQDIKMFTIKFDDENKKRLNGTLAIIENCSNKEILNKENWQKDLNLGISDEIINTCEENGKLYLFLDAIEVFNYNSANFLNEKELKEDYDVLSDIIKIKEF